MCGTQEGLWGETFQTAKQTKATTKKPNNNIKPPPPPHHQQQNQVKRQVRKDTDTVA